MNADFCRTFLESESGVATNAKVSAQAPSSDPAKPISDVSCSASDAINLVTQKAESVAERPQEQAKLVILNNNNNSSSSINHINAAKTSANQLNKLASLSAIKRIGGCVTCSSKANKAAVASTSANAVESLIIDKSCSKRIKICNTCCLQEILAKAEFQCSKPNHNRQVSLEAHDQSFKTNETVSQQREESCQKEEEEEESKTNNQTVDDYSNSSMFWKFVSNLPKSILQRRGEESSSLNPEVVDYLLATRKLVSRQQQEVDNLGSKRTKNMTESTSEQLEKETRLNMSEEAQKAITAKQQSSTEIPMQESLRLTKVLPKLPDESAKVLSINYNNENKELQVKKLSSATTVTTRSSVSSLSSCILSTSSTSEVRLKWGKKMDFLLSIIGFAVDLANIWRFPYLVYKNGGGVFFIPYTIMLIFGGIPLFFLELCLGQFVKKGPITVWNKICPSMKGVGYCSILVSWYVSFYYNVLIAWSVYFIYRSVLSFGSKMPWEDCDNEWNSKGTCVSISQLKELCSTKNETLESCRKEMFSAVNVTSPASEFFVKELSQLDQSSGLDDMGYLRPELVLCLLVVYLLHYMSLFRGLETSGKVVWVTATAPYIILSILLVRGLFLPGASMGIQYYLSPKLERLSDPQVWIDAAGQVFYSIGVGFGVHLTYASFNSHNNNCHRDCLMTSAVNAVTSAYSGLVVFVYLGYMANNLGIEIDKVASEGYSLIFEVYPEALTTLPFARFWSILFFIMLLTLGIVSAMGGLESVITGLEDEFKFAKRLSRGQLTGLVIFSSFLPALISCTQGGAYTIFWFDIYSAGVSLLFSALFETIGVVYCYGLKKFIPNIESMLGRKPHFFYIICWKYISPLFLCVVIFMSIYTASVPTYRNYTFPIWSIVLGWILAFSSVAAVPIFAMVHWFSNWRDRINGIKTPDRRRRTCSGSAGSSSKHGSSPKKSPNHHTRPVLVSCAEDTRTGVQTTTSTILTTATPTPTHSDQLGGSKGLYMSCSTNLALMLCL